jgi:hypothetical protein
MKPSFRNNTQYGYPLPRALKTRTVFQDYGVGKGVDNVEEYQETKQQQQQTDQKPQCINGVCPLPTKNNPSDRYPCGFRNFH